MGKKWRGDRKLAGFQGECPSFLNCTALVSHGFRALLEGKGGGTLHAIRGRQFGGIRIPFYAEKKRGWRAEQTCILLLDGRDSRRSREEESVIKRENHRIAGKV